MSQIEPLAYRIKPKSLADIIGQKHLLEKNSALQKMLQKGLLSSIIFYGPPGIGKTALANVIASLINAEFFKLNAVVAKIDDLRQIIKIAEKNKLANKKTIVFIDEIHRFNKAQQDALLPLVEEGLITLIGATTQNPFYSIIPALISRTQIFNLKPLSIKEIVNIVQNALAKDLTLKELKLSFDKDAIEYLAEKANGDARIALNTLEMVCLAKSDKKIISKEDIGEAIQAKKLVYDENEHYDTISAFIKSMRGSDPSATIYWLAKMLQAGEDPLFIARRIVICASEDIGLADSHALVLANSARQAIEFVGMPEARIILAHIAIYLACAPKSNSAIKAIDSALQDIENELNQAVPNHLKNAHYQKEKELGVGKNYKYPHDFGGFIKQDYLTNYKNYYMPSQNGLEAKIKEKLIKLEILKEK